MQCHRNSAACSELLDFEQVHRQRAYHGGASGVEGWGV